MDKKTWDTIQSLLRLAKEQDRLAKENADKGEPSFNLHSAQAEQLRQKARKIREDWQNRN